MSPRAVWEFPLTLPRHAFNARDTARAGEVWRLCQEAAVEAATRAGWSPQRFRQSGTAFVVRTMTVRHAMETTYGEELTARTWVWAFRRNMMSTREVRLSTARGLVAAATQQWVHVDETLRPVRASDELLAAFPPYEAEPSVELPDCTARPGRCHTLSLECWHTWMDPLDHVNHPAYLDWCDEATSRVMAETGLDPGALQPVADRVSFRAGAKARDRITVETQRRGITEDGDLVLDHRITKADGTRCADATTVRRLADENRSLLIEAFD